MSTLWKIILSIVVAGILICCGLVASVFAAFTFTDVFYVNSVLVIAVVIVMLNIMKIWNLFKPRTIHIAYGVTADVMILTVAGFEINKAYENSIDEINEQGVDIVICTFSRKYGDGVFK